MQNNFFRISFMANPWVSFNGVRGTFTSVCKNMHCYCIKQSSTSVTYRAVNNVSLGFRAKLNANLQISAIAFTKNNRLYIWVPFKYNITYQFAEMWVPIQYITRLRTTLLGPNKHSHPRQWTKKVVGRWKKLFTLLCLT